MDKKLKHSNYFDGNVFYDIDIRWQDTKCRYPRCSHASIGRVNYGDTKKYPPMGYMPVCNVHLLKFVKKYVGTSSMYDAANQITKIKEQ